MCERKYGGYGKECKNIKLSIVKNEPHVNTKIKTAKLAFPESLKKCLSRRIFFPEIVCENKQTEKCIKLPVIKKEKVTVQLCKVNPGAQDCQTQSVYLPKTVCQLPPVKKPQPEKVQPHPKDPVPTYRVKTAEAGPSTTTEKAYEARQGKKEDVEANVDDGLKADEEEREGKARAWLA